VVNDIMVSLMEEKKGVEVYKGLGSDAVAREIEQVKDEVLEEQKEVLAKLKDPMLVGALMYRTVKEREASNEMLKGIFEKLGSLEQRIVALEQMLRPVYVQEEKQMLPDVDEEIIAFISLRGSVCAEDIQKAMSYKGRNAASARLNRLYERGLLEKRQVGRKVVYACLKPSVVNRE